MNLFNTINGSGHFDIIDATNNMRYNFSPYFQGLLYTFAPEIIEHNPTKTGVPIQIPLGWRYWYEIDYEQLVYTEDGMKMQDVLNKLMEGKTMLLMPHVDVSNRLHRIYIDPEQTMDLHNNYWGQGNKGLIVAFKTARRPKLDWESASSQGLNLTPVGPDLDNVVWL